MWSEYLVGWRGADHRHAELDDVLGNRLVGI